MESDKCRCGCKKKLIDKNKCDKRFIWNPSYCSCECDKSCVIGEYLDYKNRKCRQRIAGSLVVKCSKIINENEMIYNEILNAIPLNVY